MRALIRRGGFAAAGPGLLLAWLACTPEAPSAVVRQARIGVHDVRFVVPAGWHHVDHGNEHRFQDETRWLALVDLGPATPAGFARRIREARALFERGQWEDARARLVSIDPRSFFARTAQWRAIESDWRRVTWIEREDASAPDTLPDVDVETRWAVEGAFDRLLAATVALEHTDFETLARRAAGAFEEGALREVVDVEATTLSGRPAIRLSTWDRLSHRERRSHLFVLNDEHLFCVKTVMGRGPELASGFEALAGSVALAPAQRVESSEAGVDAVPVVAGGGGGA